MHDVQASLEVGVRVSGGGDGRLLLRARGLCFLCRRWARRPALGTVIPLLPRRGMQKRRQPVRSVNSSLSNC